MIQYSTTLNNPYYFVTESVLFAIGNAQDEDKCGKKLVSYKQLVDKNNTPVTQDVKKGETYLDENHDLKIAESNKTVNVYGDELNHTKCSAVFPHFKVTYQYNEGEEGGEQTTNTVVFDYYLQSMIAVGDKFSSNTFVMNNKHTGSGDTTYLAAFQNSIKEDIANYVEKGFSLEDIKNVVPNWYFASNVGQEFDVNGKKMQLVSVSNDITQISDDDLMDEIYKKINEMTVKFANERLNVYEKELKDDSETIVTKSKVKNI